MKKSSGAGSQGNFIAIFFLAIFHKKKLFLRPIWYFFQYFLASYLPLASLSLANTKCGWRNSLIAGFGHGRSSS